MFTENQEENEWNFIVTEVRNRILFGKEDETEEAEPEPETVEEVKTALVKVSKARFDQLYPSNSTKISNKIGQLFIDICKKRQVM